MDVDDCKDCQPSWNPQGDMAVNELETNDQGS